MFSVLEHDEIEGAYVVRGSGSFAGQVAVFTGPMARERAEAYAQWLNSGAARLSSSSDTPSTPLEGESGRSAAPSLAGPPNSSSMMPRAASAIFNGVGAARRLGQAG
jgi:hypothetical protein